MCARLGMCALKGKELWSGEFCNKGLHQFPEDTTPLPPRNEGRVTSRKTKFQSRRNALNRTHARGTLATLLPHFQITTFATRGWRQVAEYRISSIVARSENISQNISDNSPLKSCFFFFFLLFSLHSVCRFSLKKFADFLYLSHCL